MLSLKEKLYTYKKNTKKKVLITKKQISEYLNLFFYIFNLRYIKRNKTFLIFTADYWNVGDLAIYKAQKDFLEKNGIKFCELPYKLVCELCDRKLIRLFNGTRIFFNGGGYLGTIWFKNELYVRQIITSNPKSEIVFLPNTVFYEDNEFGKSEFEKSVDIYNAHKNLTVFCREKISYEKVKDRYKNVYLIPDIVLSLPVFRYETERRGCILCLRSDVEKTLDEEKTRRLTEKIRALFSDVTCSDMVRYEKPLLSERENIVEDKMRQFCGAQLVVTDRLHAMIFCAITQTPCIVLESKSTKLRGCYEWIKELGYIKFCSDADELEELYTQVSSCERDYTALDINSRFEKLREICLKGGKK